MPSNMQMERIELKQIQYWKWSLVNFSHCQVRQKWFGFWR